MRKKAQNQQVFVFILGAVIMAAVLLLGVRFVRSTLGHSEEAMEVNFITGVKNQVASMESDYGSVETKTFRVAGGTDEVCFVDNRWLTEPPTTTPPSSDERIIFKDLSEIIKDEARLGENNFFIIKDGVPLGDSAGNLRMRGQSRGGQSTGLAYVCFKPINGRIEVEFEGVKGGVAVFNPLDFTT